MYKNLFTKYKTILEEQIKKELIKKIKYNCEIEIEFLEFGEPIVYTIYNYEPLFEDLSNIYKKYNIYDFAKQNGLILDCFNEFKEILIDEELFEEGKQQLDSDSGAINLINTVAKSIVEKQFNFLNNKEILNKINYIFEDINLNETIENKEELIDEISKIYLKHINSFK